MVLRTILLSSCFLILTACSSNSQSDNDLPEMLSGQEIYHNNCASCHRVDGSGGISGAKDLRKTMLDLAQIKTMIKDGKNGMMPFKDMLSKEDIDAVATYIQDFSEQ